MKEEQQKNIMNKRDITKIVIMMEDLCRNIRQVMDIPVYKTDEKDTDIDFINTLLKDDVAQAESSGMTKTKLVRDLSTNPNWNKGFNTTHTIITNYIIRKQINIYKCGHKIYVFKMTKKEAEQKDAMLEMETYLEEQKAKRPIFDTHKFEKDKKEIDVSEGW